MRSKTLALAGVLVIVASALPYGQTRPQPATASGYLTPPQAIIDILDAPPTPGVSVSPDRRTVALTYRRSMPTIAELAEPIHRIAGTRINPKTNGPRPRPGPTCRSDRSQLSENDRTTRRTRMWILETGAQPRKRTCARF